MSDQSETAELRRGLKVVPALTAPRWQHCTTAHLTASTNGSRPEPNVHLGYRIQVYYPAGDCRLPSQTKDLRG
jgi:hypothetical protein